jgi:hypothetical protein
MEYYPLTEYDQTLEKIYFTLEEARRDPTTLTDDLLFEVVVDIISSKNDYSLDSGFETRLDMLSGDMFLGYGYDLPEYQSCWIEGISPKVISQYPIDGFDYLLLELINTPYGVRMYEYNPSNEDRHPIILSDHTKLDLLEEFHWGYVNTLMAISEN